MIRYDFKKATHSLLRLAVICLLLGIGLTTAAADVWEKWDSFSDENKDNEGVEDYVWKEDGSHLPAYPQEKDLIEVDGPPSYRHYQYLIDEQSLTIGKDRVARFSLIIRSKSGADNVFYDGLRCSSNELKNYAYGVTDSDGNKKFTARENPRWQAFRSSGMTAYGAVFAASYFCDHNALNLKRHEIIYNMKYGKGDVDGLYY